MSMRAAAPSAASRHSSESSRRSTSTPTRRWRRCRREPSRCPSRCQTPQRRRHRLSTISLAGRFLRGQTPSQECDVTAVELVTVAVDGKTVEVPKGLGLVETALAAGIEIPVFCYEPRLGAPIGACRMCLVEVEGGPPKPQAACTLTAQDGMVVKTAATSEKAAEAQNATLEFILVNHPLDCPVCDKGGECPLQDLTFRYGPGATRMTFPKRT